MANFFSGGITKQNAFLQNNPRITRFPTNQREWNGFIQELTKLIPDYEGTYDATAAGFSGAPFAFTITYHRYGKLVMLRFPAQEATSNATTFSISSMPTRLRPAVTNIVPMPMLVDNGTPITTAGQARVSSDGVIIFGIDGADGGFTASGAKGFGDVAGPSIIYTLFDAERID